MVTSPSKLKQRQRNFLGKDFDSLRSNLLDYAKLYYPDRISDFSENSMGGLFLDMAAYVGDTLSFYLDHQFNELDPNTVVELSNIQKILRASGIPVMGAAPATVTCNLYFEVPAKISSNGSYVPDESSLPIVSAGSVFMTSTGKKFILSDDIDFYEKNSNGDYIATWVNGTIRNGIPSTLIVSRVGICVSGTEKTTNIALGDFVQFRNITLEESDITEIIKVYDSDGNTYYEVNDLSEDVVYKTVKNFGADSATTPYNLQITPAPYRFKKSMDINSRLTTLTFGGGEASSLQDDAVPDAADFALQLPFSKSFSRTSLNPQKLLSTRTLGVCSSNTTLYITYRFGGGLSDNVAMNTINSVSERRLQFPRSPSPSIAQSVADSFEVINPEPASGGEDPLSPSELIQLVSSARNSQERIVTKEDLLARVYTLPSSLGRAYRASVRPNPNNPLSTRLYIVSRDGDGLLTQSNDSLKINLARYLNTYRTVSDSIDILDSPIVNLKLKFNAVLDSRLNSSIVLQEIISSLKSFFDKTRWQIDQPIFFSDIMDVIFSVNGVISLPSANAILFEPLFGTQNGRLYSNYAFNVNSNLLVDKGVLVPPEGGIFEIRYPDFDIEGNNV